MKAWWKNLMDPPLDERTEIKADKISQTVIDINKLVKEFQEKADKKDDSSRDK